MANTSPSKVNYLYNHQPASTLPLTPSPETKTTPKLTLDTPTDIYVIICIDLDAPFTSLPFLSPVLHWLQGGVGASKSASQQSNAELEFLGKSCVAEYVGAGPPPGAAPHHYVFLLYEQPEDFDVKKLGHMAESGAFPIRKRARYDFEGLIRDAKLGTPVAANWITSN
jgi:phosphatidylethanolamine-binding protein